MSLLVKFDIARVIRLSKESFWVLLGQSVAVLGALIGIRVLTELINPEEYGQFALGMTIATLTGQALMGPLSAGAARFFLSASEACELKSYLIGVCRLLLIIVTAILLFTGLVAIAAMVFGYGKWVALLIASVAFAIFSGCNSIANGIQNAGRQRATVALHSGIAPWLRLVIAVALIYLCGISSVAVIWGYAIATIVILISQYIFFESIWRKANQLPVTNAIRREFWQKRILSYSWPFSTWGMFAALHLASDRWSLAAFSSQADVGYFSVLYQLGYYPVAIMTEMLVALISPVIFQRAGDGSSTQQLINSVKLNTKIVGFVLLVTGLVFIFTLIAHEYIFNIFVAIKYGEISFLLPWFTLSAGFIAAGHVLSISKMSSLGTKELIKPKAFTAILGIFLNLLGAYMYGLQGVVIAQIIFSLAYFVWMLVNYINFSRNLEFSLPQEKISIRL